MNSKEGIWKDSNSHDNQVKRTDGNDEEEAEDGCVRWAVQ